MNIEIYYYQQDKKLIKQADSKNDHTIPQEICTQEMSQITDINVAQSILTDLHDNNNIDILNLNNEELLQKLNIAVKYIPDTALGEQGLLCITSENNEHITAKLVLGLMAQRTRFADEFYVYKLDERIYQQIKDAFYDQIKNAQLITKRQIDGKLHILYHFINQKYYYAMVLVHDVNIYKNLALQSINKRCIYYPKNQIFNKNIIAKAIYTIMQLLQFKEIN